MLASKKFIDTTGPVRFVGRWAWITSIYGFAGILIVFVIILIGTPYGYEVVRQPCQDPCQIYGQLTATNFADLQRIGISADTYAIFYVTVLWIFTVIALSVSALILWKKPGELLPFCGALLIMSLPSIEGQFVFFSGLFQDYPVLGKFFDYYSAPFGWTTAYLFLTFPNGKFKGKIFWLLFLITGIAPTLTGAFLDIAGIEYNADPNTLSLPVALPLTFLALIVSFSLEKNFSLRNIGKYLAWTVMCILAIVSTVFLSEFLVYLVALIYRSKVVLTPRERVSTKWLIYGFTIFVSMLLAFYIIFPLFPALYEPGNYFFIFFNLVGFFGCGVNLTGILMAVLYGNAFDINIVIKRTVVYTTLSIFVVAIYLGSVVVLQELVRVITGQESGLAVVGATLIAALLFQPLRQNIQGFVDRRFYRRKYDASRTIAALSASLQNETDLANLTHQVKAVINETMQPEMVTVWVKNKARPNSVFTIK